MNKKIELQDVFRVLRRNLLVITLVSIIGMLAIGSYSVLTSKQTYRLQSTLVLSPKNEKGFQLNELTLYEKMMGTYVELGKNNVVTSQIRQQVSKEILNTITSVDLSAKKDSQLLVVEIVGTNEKALAEYMPKFLEIYGHVASETISDFRLSVLSTENIQKTNLITKHITNVIIGFVGSALVVVAVLIFIDLLKDKVRSAQELSELFMLPLLGSIPKKESKESKKKSRKERGDSLFKNSDVELLRSPLSTVSESYRMLRSHLDVKLNECNATVLLITSSIPSEGKTTTSVNLAVSQAQLGKKVLLIDGDLRKASVHKILKLDKGVGLSDLLEKDVTDPIFKKVPISSAQSLTVLTAGSMTNYATELLTNPRMSKFIAYIREKFDLIIIDTPPLLSATDAQIISNYVDGVVLVSDINKVKRSELIEISRILQISFRNVIGVVANNVDEKYNPYYYHEY